MADNFEKAVLASFDQGLPVDIRAQADSFLAQLKDAPVFDWKFFLQRFAMSPHQQVKFYCLHVLIEQIGKLTADERAQCEAGLVEWIAGPCVTNPVQEAYIKNKLAALYVAGIKADYPVRWNAFNELIVRLNHGVPVVDMLLRVLDATDVEFVSTDIVRSREEATRAMEVKDAMRIDCIGTLVDIWFQVLHGYQTQQLPEPALTNDCLQLIKKYIVWIDVAYIFHERYITLFYTFLGDAAVRAAAAGCVAALLYKGMDHSHKLAMVNTLRLSEILAQCGPLHGADDVDFACELARVVNTAVSELMGIDGCANDQLKSEMWQIVSGLMPATLQYFAHPDDLVTEELLPCINMILDSLRQMQQLAASQPAGFEVHIEGLLKVLMVKIQYCSDYNFEDETEYEAEWQELRRLLMKTFRKVLAFSPKLATQLVMQSVQQALEHHATLPFVQVEAALHLLYVMGESSHQFSGQKSCQLPMWISDAVIMAIQSSVSTHSQRCVTLAYHDLIERYMQVALQNNNLIPVILQAFVDQRGLQHPHPQVRGRSAYLLKRAVKRLRGVPMLVQHSEQLILHLLQLLGGAAGSNMAFEDKLQVLEVLGTLVCSDAFTEQQQFEKLSAALAPMTDQLQRLSQDPRLQHDALVAQQLGCAVEAVGAASKSCPRNNPACERVFGAVLQVVVSAIPHWPPLPELTFKVLFFLHRMVDNSSPGPLIPWLKQVLPALLLRVHSKDELMKVLLLVNQIAMRYRQQAAILLDELFQPTVQLINQLMSQLGSGQGNSADLAASSASEEHREWLELQKAYIDFLYTLVAHDVSQVLVSPLNKRCLESVLGSVLDCAVKGAPDAQKSAFHTLKWLVDLWGADGGFVGLIKGRIVPIGYQCILASGFELTSGDNRVVLHAVAALQHATNAKIGPEAAVRLLSEVLPPLGIPPAAAAQYGQQMITLASELEIRELMKRLVQSVS